MHVLILSMHPEDRFAVRALRAGAGGYLTKESAAQELISAIRRLSGAQVREPDSRGATCLAFDIETGKPAHQGSPTANTRFCV